MKFEGNHDGALCCNSQLTDWIGTAIDEVSRVQSERNKLGATLNMKEGSARLCVNVHFYSLQTYMCLHLTEEKWNLNNRDAWSIQYCYCERMVNTLLFDYLFRKQEMKSSGEFPVQTNTDFICSISQWERRSTVAVISIN